MPENTQSVPPGIPTATQQAAPQPAQQSAPQQQPAGQPTPYDQYQQPEAPRPPQQHVQQEPEAPKNPFSKESYADQGEPAKPAEGEQPRAQEQPQEPEAPKFDKSVDSIVGDLKSDDYAAPALTYIENVCDGKVDMQRAFGKAVEYGDTNLIDSAYLKEVLGDQADAVARQAKAVFEYSAGRAERALEEVYRDFGGKEQVQQAGQYFNDAADPAEKAAIKAMLDSGKPEQVKYAVAQIRKFAEGAGMTYNAHPQPYGQAGAMQGLSKQEYQDIMFKEKNMQPERYEQLKEMRKLGMKQGR